MNRRRFVPLLLVCLDLASVVVVFNAVVWLRGAPGLSSLFSPALLVPFLVLVLTIHLIDGYSPRTDMLSLAYTSQQTIAVLTGMLAMLLITFVLIKDPYALQSSRIVVALSFVILVPVTLSYRRLITLRLAGARTLRPIIFVGSQASCISFKDTCELNQVKQRVHYVATDVADHESIAPWGSVEMHAVPHLFELVDRHGGHIEAIVLDETSRDLPFAVSEKLMELHFSGVSTYTLDLFYEVYWRKIPLNHLNQTWLFQEGFQIARDPIFEHAKRLSDIVFAIAGLIVTAPLSLACAAAIWLEDRGPILFVQPRVGKNRVPFSIRKFRTMKAGPATGDLYTRPNDARVTRVGRLLRAVRLDEIPQLWNVLRGDMSLIGPRAEWTRLVERYQKEIPCYNFRHLVKPGITGWAQVNYPYGANLDDTRRKLEYDLYYIRSFSFTLDASIIFKTIHIMLGGKGR